MNASVKSNKTRPGKHTRRVVLSVVGLAILPVVIFITAYTLMPTGIHGFRFMLAFYSFWASLVASTAVTFLLRFKLTTVEGDSEQVLSDLTHRLRISGFRVSEKPGELIVTTSSIASVKVKVEQVSETTLVYCQSYATPTGWSVILILLLFIYFAPVALAVSLYLLYHATVFAYNRLLPRLSQLPIPSLKEGRGGTRAMLIDGLSEGRRLSAEAYEAARSRYHDYILIIMTLGLITSFGVIVLTAKYTPEDVFGMNRMSFSLLLGFVAALTFVFVAWRILASTTSPLIRNLRSWKDRLELALAREAASEHPPDDELSSFELMTEASMEVPKWMEIRRKAGTFRQPADWLLIFFFGYLAVMGAFAGVLYMYHGVRYWPFAFAASALFTFLAVAFYSGWRKNTREEIESTVGEWGKRHDKLMADMEAFVRSV